MKADWFFCPYCGKKAKEKPVNIGFGAQLGLYILSVLLPPLNIITAIKYIKDPQPNAKIIGWVSVVLMLATIITVSLWSLDKVNKAREEFEKQFSGFEYLYGY